MSCHETEIFEEAKREAEEEVKIKISVKGKVDNQEFSDYDDAIQFLNAMWSKEMDEEDAEDIKKAFVMLTA